ncbi:glycoside hydrolase family 1 protein [Verrucomicrobiota bacterium sgz303538]
MNREEFLWGVATSAYQSEGGYNGPGQPRTNWAKAEERGDVAVSGVAADFWHRYEEDFDRCRALGLNAFRLGIEWSRVQPTAGRLDARRSSAELSPADIALVSEVDVQAAQGFDRKALDQYAAILGSCQEHGLEPVVTLHHFVHPAWLGPDAWLDPRTPALFTNYVREVVAYLNARLVRPIRWFITINEPNMLVLNSYLGRQFPAGAASGLGVMTAAYNGLLTAHIAAYNVIHDLYADAGWPTPRVSLNNYCSDLYWSDKLLLDILCARERGVERNGVGEYIGQCVRVFEEAFDRARIPLHKDLSYFFGSAVKRVSNWLGYRSFDAAHFAPLLDALYSSPRERVLDYIGLDYYDPFAAHAFRLPVFWDHEFKNKSFRSWVLSTVTSKWWDWRVLPRGLHFFCRHYAQDFRRPVLIAENGMAIRRRADNTGLTQRRDKITRSQFLRLHVHEVTKIVNDGVPLMGYLHWSLFDNYEWGSYTPRFGLYSIDYQQGTERNDTDPWGDQPPATYAALVAEAREKMRHVATIEADSL